MFKNNLSFFKTKYLENKTKQNVFSNFESWIFEARRTFILIIFPPCYHKPAINLLFSTSIQKNPNYGFQQIGDLVDFMSMLPGREFNGEAGFCWWWTTTYWQ